ncbi:hypothetical protein ACI8AA_23775 [Geodermatophilus sp. SYSU D01180]
MRDALSTAATLFPNWDEDLARSLVADFGLPPRRPVKKLSRGMVSAVGITIGLASRAPLTLFDEPYPGLDAVARQLFYDRLIADYAENPRTIVLSTHLIDEISGLLEHVLLVDAGRVLLDDDADDLRAAALTVTGRADAVAALGRQHEVLTTETLGGSSRAVVRLRGPVDTDDLAAAGVTAERTPLQQLVAALNAPQRRVPPAGPGGARRRPVLRRRPLLGRGHPMDRTFAAARLHLVNPLQIIGIPWGIALLSFAINLPIWALTGAGDRPGGGITGGVLSLYIAVLVVFVPSVTQLLPFSMGMSLSRRTFHRGTAVVAVGSALVYGVVLATLVAVEDATGGWGVRLNSWAPGKLDVDNWALQVVVSGAPMLAAAFLGVAFGVVMKRWGQLGRWSLLVGGLLRFGGLAILVSWQRARGDLGTWLTEQSMVTLAVLVPAALGVIAAALSFAGLRRIVPRGRQAPRKRTRPRFRQDGTGAVVHCRRLLSGNAAGPRTGW